jgi:hypothetical protein
MYGPEYQTKEADKNTKETLNTPKRATAGSIQLPHLTNIQLYWMRKTNINNSKTDLGTQRNLYQYMLVMLQPLLHSYSYYNKYELNQIKIQPKTSESYRTITQALTKKQTEFHTYRLTEERNNRVVLKNMHYSINPEEVKAEIEKLGHTVSNIWNIKQYRTKLPLSMFFVALKAAPNNKDIYKVEYLQQFKPN